MRSLVLAAALALAAGPLSAQESPLLLRLPASARALALGNVLPPGAAAAEAAFYYPAFFREMTGVAGSMLWLGADTVGVSAAGAGEWLGGTIAIALRSASYSDGCRCAFPAILTAPPPVPVSERVAQIGYGRSLKGIGLALTAKYIDQRWNLDRGARWALDGSAGRALGPVRLALAARNLGPDLHVGDVTVPLARQLSIAGAPPGAAPVGPLDLLPLFQLTWERGARFAPAAGLEVGYWPVAGRTVFLRGGVRRTQPSSPERPFTLGAGFSGDRIALDYALLPLHGGRATHQIGVRWH